MCKVSCATANSLGTRDRGDPYYVKVERLITFDRGLPAVRDHHEKVAVAAFLVEAFQST